MSGLFDHPAIFLLGVVALAWFAMRYFYGQKSGTTGLTGMFRKEKAPEIRGMGRKAIRSLLDEIERLVAGDAGLRGAILIGAFAAEKATPKNRVEIILLARSPDEFLAPESLARWGYPRRGHGILAHEVSKAEGVIRHQLRLHGAPEVAMHILDADLPRLPAALMRLLAEGAIVIAAGTGASAALERWKKERE